MAEPLRTRTRGDEGGSNDPPSNKAAEHSTGVMDWTPIGFKDDTKDP